MKITVFLFLLIGYSMMIPAQPGNRNLVINEAAYQQPFLHCVTNEKYFANYAIEAAQHGYKIPDTIQCKLHLPLGFNYTWKEIEKNNPQHKGDFDYTNDFWVGIRFNFFIDGNKVSTAYHQFEKPKDDDSPFTFYFELNPTDDVTAEGDINAAYAAVLTTIKTGYHQLVIQALLPSKDVTKKNDAPIISGGFSLLADKEIQEQWKEQRLTKKPLMQAGVATPIPVDYNSRLRQLADSTMIRHFGKAGFKKYFTMTCLQNPCTGNYMYANTFTTTNPCTLQPQGTCKEAIVTYHYKMKGVPLKIKMLVTIKDEGEYAQIEDNQFGQEPIAFKKLKILPVEMMQAKMNEQFPLDSLSLIGYNSPLAYYRTRLTQPQRDTFDKINRAPGFNIIKETPEGKKWENGFVYLAKNTDPNKLPQVYTFDAITGKLLWETQIYNVAD